MSDTTGLVHDMRLPCSTCGHRYGEHIDGDRGPCATEIALCACAHFTLGDTTAGDEREALALTIRTMAVGGVRNSRELAGAILAAGWRRDGDVEPPARTRYGVRWTSEYGSHVNDYDEREDAEAMLAAHFQRQGELVQQSFWFGEWTPVATGHEMDGES